MGMGAVVVVVVVKVLHLADKVVDEMVVDEMVVEVRVLH